MKNIVYATMADIDEMKRIMDEAAESAAGSDWYVTDDKDFIARHIEDEGYVLKYMCGDTIAAFLIVRFPGCAKDNLGEYLQEYVPEESERLVHMESLAVSASYRGNGLQRKLLRKAEEIQRKRGTGYLMATVHPDNVFSLSNFEKEGYECIAEVTKYGGLRRKILCRKLF